MPVDAPRPAIRRLSAFAAILALVTATLTAIIPAHADDPPAASTTANAAAPDDAAAPLRFGDGTPHEISYDKYSLKIDGERQYLWSGEFHYFRLPSPGLWRDVLEKFKANGFNSVSFYFSWAYHSPKPGVYDFTGVRDIDRLLDIAEDVGLYVIARPGPYINAEVDSGGFPGWLQTVQGRARSDADDYQAAWEEWYDHVNAIIAQHQLTDGGGSVVLYQIENEYDRSGTSAATYMEELKAAARADGITVPLMHNDKGRELRWACGTGAPDLYATDTYPGVSATNYEFLRDGTSFEPDRCGVGDRPFIWAEFQGGWFQPWGGALYDDARPQYGTELERISYGNNIDNHFTVQNLYMLFGGTNWGWQADPVRVYTSYDYHAAFDEARQQTFKVPVVKQQGYFVDAVKDLRALDNLPEQLPHSNPALHVSGDRNPDTGMLLASVRHESVSSRTTEQTTIDLDTPDGAYTVPQQPGTAITVDGQDFKLLVANYDMDDQHLVYSTSEIFTHFPTVDRDVAVLHTRPGEDGETVLRYDSEPRVDVREGDVDVTWDAERGDLRLDYTGDGIARVRIGGGGHRALDLLLVDSDTVNDFWKADTSAGRILVRGGSLLRDAQLTADGTLTLRGDADTDEKLEVWAPPWVQRIVWNGKAKRFVRTDDQTYAFDVDGPAPVDPIRLSTWRTHAGAPEAQPGFDDSGWTIVDHMTTTIPTRPDTLPVLYADEYGYHYGDVWYRGHFRATGQETGIDLRAGTGGAGFVGVWLNGDNLGTVRSSATGSTVTGTVPFPAESLRPGEDNVVSVLVRNMGHNEDGGSNDGHKEPRGLRGATVKGSGATPTWRIQGARGGEDLFDTVRGPQNNGGLFGERAGWTLPGYPDGDWATATLPASAGEPGLTWYRTNVDLDLPVDQDVPLSLTFDELGGHYRALIFVNGWNLGQFVADIGPQRAFVIPQGILDHQGGNTIAMAVWSDDGTQPTGVSLVPEGNVRTSLSVPTVASPSYDAAKYAMSTPVSLAVDGPSVLGDGETDTVTASVTVPPGSGAASASGWTLTAPTGWQVEPVSSDSAAATWRVTAPSGRSLSEAALMRVSADVTTGGETRTLHGVRAIGAPPPPPPPPEPGVVYVSDLPFVEAINGWGPPERDMSNGENAGGDGHTIIVGETSYAKGLGVHALSRVTVDLPAGCTTFKATVGLDAEDRAGNVQFAVLTDEVEKWRSVTITGNTVDQAEVDVTGAARVTLFVDPLGSNGHDHSDWANARFTGCDE